LLLLSNCDPLRWARSWWAALRAAFFPDRNIDCNRSSQLVASDMSLATSFFISLKAHRALILLLLASHPYSLSCCALDWCAALQMALIRVPVSFSMENKITS